MMEAAKNNTASGLTAKNESVVFMINDVDNDLLSAFQLWWSGAQAMADIYKRKYESNKEDA